jgi:hypothetical protein
MDRIRKALETIALGYSQGNCSVDKLIKACNQYKNKLGLIDNIDYDLKVAKSCIDYINNMPQDIEICKAIIPGQTKVVDGIMYIYSRTKNGAKQQYDWHVVRKGAKTSANIGRGSKLSDAKIQSKQKYINDLFPNDLSSIKIIKRLGGSTGAQLVEDLNGNQYVLKKGSNTNNEHVASEYLSNQLYNILGLRTPDYELYEENGENYLLSRYIQGTHEPKPSDYKKMSEGFIADCVLANWDVYKNDNCRIKDANGTVYRVDNGGCLDFRAQGAKKNFDSNVKSTYDSMFKFNPLVPTLLSFDEQLQQIKDIQSKHDDIVNFLKESGRDDLAKIIGERIDNLNDVADYINQEILKQADAQAAKMKKVRPRTLKSESDMYSEIDEARVNELIDDTAKEFSFANNKNNMSNILHILRLNDSQKNGWSLLYKICNERGFTARPRVLTEDEFWKEKQKNDNPLLLRGFDSVNYVSDFIYSDRCHYGQYAVWGQGIYAHVDDESKSSSQDKHSDFKVLNNKNDKNTYKSSGTYIAANSYTQGIGDDTILPMFWEKDANVVNADDLLDEVKAIGAGSRNPKVAKLKKELDTIKDEWMKNQSSINNLEETIKQKVYSDMHYDENSVKDMIDTIQNTNWGSRNMRGKRNYPMFDDFVKNKIKSWVESCGGSTEIINENMEDEQIHIVKGNAELYISKYSWNNNAVKQKNSFTVPYHYQAEKFQTFFDTNFIKPVKDAITSEINSGNIGRDLRSKVIKNESDYYKKKNEYDDEVNKSIPDNIYGYIYNICKDLNYRSRGRERSVLGIYAALRGYDGIIQPDGNDHGHSFCIVLNRSKIVTMAK